MAPALSLHARLTHVEQTVMWFGALLVFCGIVVLAWSAINRGRLSNSHTDPLAGQTLEPTHRGVRFLGLGQNWPGILLILIGALVLLAGAF